MKQSVKHLILGLVATAIIAPMSAMAQPDDKDAKKEKKEVEHIIIQRKGGTGDKAEKIIVEVDGDKVLVNGKPVDEKSADAPVTVHRYKIKDADAMNHQFYYNYNGNNLSRAFGGNPSMTWTTSKSVILGVSTEKAENGVVIRDVTKEAGAEKAGLKKGDIITQIDGKKIATPDELSKEIKTHKAGDKVTVTYLRDKKEAKVTAEISEWKAANAFSADALNSFNFDLGDLGDIMPNRNPGVRVFADRTGAAPRMGISVQDTEDGKGVKVLRVDEEGTAGKAGVKVDDIITEVDGKDVKSADEVSGLIKASKDKASVKFKVKRGGKTENIEVKVPKRLKTANL